MNFERMKQAVMCKHCKECVILKLHYRCMLLECTCTEEKEFITILDLYAFLYHFLDNINYIDYESLALRDFNRVVKTRSALERKWKSHLMHREHLYSFKPYITLHDDTRNFFREEIDQTESLEDLLIMMMDFLHVLDEHLASLKLDYMNFHEDELPIPTRYGELLYRRDTVLQHALHGHPFYKPLLDPNYLLLRRRVKSFYVVQSSYPYYQVKHRYLATPRYAIENVLDLKLGFLPGQFHAGKDYRIKIDKELTDEGLLPFYFQGVNNPERYHEDVLEAYRQLLIEKPHILILPELFTPPELREELIRELQAIDVACAVQEEYTSPIFILTGSFHEEIEGNVYNLAQVVSGGGQLLLEVSKMNRFIFPSDEKYDDERAFFTKHDGVEKNAYDRREITMFETWLGRIAFFICVDFINYNVEEVLLDRQVDLILVMAMTPKPASGKFVRRMQDLAERNGCVVVVCNNLGEPIETDNPQTQQPRAVVSLPGFKAVYQSGKAMIGITLKDIIEEIVKSKPIKPHA